MPPHHGLSRLGILLTLGIAVTGCGMDSPTYRNSLMKNGELQINKAAGPSGADYVVTVRNVWDFGYDLEIKADRDRMAIAAMLDQCPKARIVDENKIENGTTGLGRQLRTYEILIKCS